ncbi:hypothetical protein Hypma_007096 [Hypsizygus marmoreus]|uniref:SH3 domain-containing protein n=1 Tax=Hypsizygus marmoreus TaxID=39966 RepID=A0A369KF94_HYPMA|nr:hypothetical protein Hypma_007096 [Hypsizygus marmoreus]
MTSAVYTESQVHNERRPLSLRLDAPPSSSPFPSPSSSFLPPPMPGAHEFAVKPAPAGRNGRKASIVHKEDEAPPLHATTPTANAIQLNGIPASLLEPESTLSPITPTPSTLQRNSTLSNGALPPASPSAATTPTPSNAPLPTSPTWDALSVSTTVPTSAVQQAPRTPTTPCSPVFYPPSPSTSAAPDTSASALTPNRPAPPSPDVSRRVSAVPSNASGRSRSSRSSRPPSTAVSRTNSTRKPSMNAPSVSQNQNRLSVHSKSTPLHTSSPLPSPHSASFSFQPPGTQSHTQPSPIATTPRTLVHVRDYAYAPTDPRFSGVGPDVPRANKVARMNRRLRGSVGSEYESSEDGDAEDDDTGLDVQWDMLKFGVGRFSSWNARPGMSVGPSQGDLDLNFAGDEEDEEEEVYYEDEEVIGEGEEPLYPGLYRAMYTFEPEGTAEMALEEDQFVRVIGRGGGVGWAVVVDEREGMGEKHALVPESYLEVVRLDWEEDVVVGVAQGD